MMFFIRDIKKNAVFYRDVPGHLLSIVLALGCKEQEDKQCDGSYVTEREKDQPLWGSNHTPSATRADVLSQLD